MERSITPKSRKDLLNIDTEIRLEPEYLLEYQIGCVRITQWYSFYMTHSCRY